MSTALLITFAGIWAIIGGIALAIAAIRARKIPGSGWGWALVSGPFTVLLVASPGVSAAVLALFLGFYAILIGITFIVLGFSIRSLGERAARS